MIHRLHDTSRALSHLGRRASLLTLLCTLSLLLACSGFPRPVEDQVELRTGEETAKAAGEAARRDLKPNDKVYITASSDGEGDPGPVGFEHDNATQPTKTVKVVEAAATNPIILQMKADGTVSLIKGESSAPLPRGLLASSLSDLAKSKRPLTLQVPATSVDSPKLGELSKMIANAGFTVWTLSLQPVSVPKRASDPVDPKGDAGSSSANPPKAPDDNPPKSP